MLKCRPMPPCDSKNHLFDTNILEIHLIQAELWQILCLCLVTMATKVGSIDGKSLNSSIFVRPINVLFDAIS